MSTQTQQLFIPEKVKVGFNRRDGTYTGSLAYVIYYDQKGVLRKEKSWESWRDKKIKPVEFDNVPTEGFVLNKGVGGQRQSYGWNARNEYIRVYDPRDFEFEISVANLLFILRECDCSRGKGLEGKFAYAWDGTELVLLPAISEDYQNSKQFTSLQNQGVKVKEMIAGASYTTKKQEDLTYLGRFDYYFMSQPNSYRSKTDASGVCKKFVFWGEKDKKFVFLKELKNVAVLKSDVVHPDFPELVAKYGKSENGSPVTGLFLKDVPRKKKDNQSYYRDDPWHYEDSPGEFVECETQQSYRDPGKIDHVRASAKYSIKNGVLTREGYNRYMYPPDRQSHSTIPWREPTTRRLFATTENGGKVRVTYNSFKKDR